MVANDTKVPDCVIVAGQIASGKTTLASLLADRHHLVHVRVRDVLTDILGGGEWDRSRMQREGADLDRRTSGQWLLHALIEMADAGSRMVVDSGRTRRQVEPILEHFTTTFLVYLEASEGTRRRRYLRASKNDPLKRNVSFEGAMNHDTEREARDLRSMSHLTVETDDLDADGVAAEVARHIFRV